MSLFGALYTAVSGLTAQSAAFTNISDNVANSQTVGFKGTDTAFIDYLTTSNATENDSGTVIARPSYSNNVQGAITASSDPTALAISGQGFFAVQQATNVSASGPTQFAPTQFYTRAGDFSLNNKGYLVNSAGDYLQGWAVDPTSGIANTTSLQTIQVNDSQFSPVATSNVALSANLPATPSPTTTTASQIQVYDALGTQHTLDINWVQNSASDWTATISSPDNASGTVIGSAEIQFGATSGNTVPEGTIGSIINVSGGVTGTSYTQGGEATLTASADFGSGAQPITIDLGGFGSSSGVTQFAGTNYTLNNVSQNGAAAGSYSGLTINTDGTVVANFDNGQSRTLAKIPLSVFADPNALQQDSGQAFTATTLSGQATSQAVDGQQAGALVVGSVESSNVDVATQFSNMIVAQQAYGASAKVITTADNMLQTTISMLQ
jgi:flagellar hook protein FlgE